MPDALYRVSIHCAVTDADRAVTADLILPAAMTVSELLPSIVGTLGITGDRPRQWQLAPTGGAPLVESMTLAQNDVRDGDVLILTDRTTPAPRSYGLTQALTAGIPESTEPAALRTLACLWSCVLGMAAVLSAGIGSEGLARPSTAAVLALAATVMAFVAPRIGLATAVVSPLQLIAVALTAVVGLLVVPSNPGAASVFLGAAAAASLGVVLLRFTTGPVEVLLAVVTLAVLVGIVAACAVLYPLGMQGFGAGLGALGTAALSLSPRLSIAIAGLTPPAPTTGDDDGDAPRRNLDVDILAERGHRTLFGLLAGSSSAAALGAVLVAAGGRHPVTFAAVAFDATIGLALVLRCRSHASGRCRTTLWVTGFGALTAALVLVVAWSPEHGSWVGAFAIAGGLAALSPTPVTSQTAVRVADAVEYGALAAVAPLACWLVGVLDVVHGFGT